MNIGIVIPTLNEEDHLAATIENIRMMADRMERINIVVVDSGSMDGTAEAAKKADVMFISKPEFKAQKNLSLNFGADNMNCDVLLFLDADCLVPVHFDSMIQKVLSFKNVVGGAFEYKMEKGGGWVYNIVQLINRIRYRITKLYFGDQGVFCEKKVFDKIGGFPNEPIMESAYFCRKLKKEGRVQLINTPVITSIRRFKAGGIHRVFWKDFWIWVQFWLGLDVSRYARKYWSANEKRTA